MSCKWFSSWLRQPLKTKQNNLQPWGWLLDVGEAWGSSCPADYIKTCVQEKTRLSRRLGQISQCACNTHTLIFRKVCTEVWQGSTCQPKFTCTFVTVTWWPNSRQGSQSLLPPTPKPRDTFKRLINATNKKLMKWHSKFYNVHNATSLKPATQFWRTKH